MFVLDLITHLNNVYPKTSSQSIGKAWSLIPGNEESEKKYNQLKADSKKISQEKTKARELLFLFTKATSAKEFSKNIKKFINLLDTKIKRIEEETNNDFALMCEPESDELKKFKKLKKGLSKKHSPNDYVLFLNHLLVNEIILKDIINIKISKDGQDFTLKNYIEQLIPAVQKHNKNDLAFKILFGIAIVIFILAAISFELAPSLILAGIGALILTTALIVNAAINKHIEKTTVPLSENHAAMFSNAVKSQGKEKKPSATVQEQDTKKTTENNPESEPSTPEEIYNSFYPK